jgi:hypothetical protein
MKFGFPLISTKLSGKLGGVVGATARGGVGYFRRRIDPSNPRSPQQGVARSVMATLSNAWRVTLTATQRASWSALAGPSESGIDAFVRGNFQPLQFEGNEPTLTAPSSTVLGEVPITAVGTYDVSDKTLAITFPNAGADIAYSVYTSRPQSASRGAQQFPFVLTTSADAGDSDLNFVAGQPPFTAIAGQVFYIRLVPWGNNGSLLGRVGQEQIFRVNCVA